jgi:nucleotide-binding universal stress UspA family protein
MYRSLLLPLDGSALAEHALPWALSIARRAGATLHVALVHVSAPVLYADSLPLGDVWDTKHLHQERAYLDGVVRRLAAASAVPVTATLLEGPVVADTLSGQATATGADLVVLTSHGRGPLSRFWLGSVADEMMRRAAPPLLLVRPREAAPDFTAEPVLRHLLIPLDGSALAEQVLEPAVALGRLMQADYALVRSYGPRVSPGLDPLTYALLAGGSGERQEAEARAYLDRVAEQLKNQGLEVRTHVVFGQHPASAILDTAQRLAVDGIALATHGRRGLPRLLLGSVADKVLRGASVPVLVHHPLGDDPGVGIPQAARHPEATPAP